MAGNDTWGDLVESALLGYGAIRRIYENPARERLMDAGQQRALDAALTSVRDLMRSLGHDVPGINDPDDLEVVTSKEHE